MQRLAQRDENNNENVRDPFARRSQNLRQELRLSGDEFEACGKAFLGGLRELEEVFPDWVLPGLPVPEHREVF